MNRNRGASPGRIHSLVHPLPNYQKTPPCHLSLQDQDACHRGAQELIDQARADGIEVIIQESETPMRTPHLATAMLAAAAMMGGSQAAMEYTLHPSPDMNTLYAPTLRTARRAKGRVATNQRQRRKDRRRSWAAGNRKAFLG